MVIPLFNEQIAAGGPVTVTHSDITRYFMTIPEAAQLVIQASSMGTGGDLFLLDMGEPVRILDLARRMIRLSGAEVRDLENPDGDIEIKITGLRPGEKIFEELLVGGKSRPTRHPRIFRAIDMEGLDVAMETIIHDLRAGVERHDEESVLEVMRRTVEGFRPTEVSRIRIVAAA